MDELLLLCSTGADADAGGDVEVLSLLSGLSFRIQAAKVASTEYLPCLRSL